MEKSYKLNNDFVLTCIKDEMSSMMYSKVNQVSLLWEPEVEATKKTSDAAQANRDFMYLRAKYSEGIRL